MQVDFGRTAEDYVKHRAGFPARFFQRLAREEVLRPGPEQIARFDTALAERFPAESLAVPHRVFTLIATRP